jgi:hypothetical protein
MYNNPKFHKYDVKNIDTKFLKGKSGLYFARDKYKIIYIGMSSNLGNRLNMKNHHVLKNYLSRIMEIYVYEVDYPLIEVYERRLIRKFEPDLNDKGTEKEIERLQKLGEKHSTKWKVIKNGVLMDIFENTYSLTEAFNYNTSIGRENYLNNRYNKLSTADLLKLKKGDEICGISVSRINNPGWPKIKKNELCEVIDEEKVKDMKSYKIGLYNSKIEDIEQLKECNIVFDNFEDFKHHVRENDEVVYISGFSLYGYNVEDMISLISKYNLNIHCVNEISLNGNFDKLSIHVLLATNEYISKNIDVIKKL